MSNNTFYASNDYRNYLEHHGIRGMKWGVRRFQNADGTYKSAGKSRYGIGDGQSYNGVKATKTSKKTLSDDERAARNAKIKKAAIAVGTVAATAAIAYAGHKYMKHIRHDAMAVLGQEQCKHLVAIREANSKKQDAVRKLQKSGKISDAVYRHTIQANARSSEAKEDRLYNVRVSKQANKFARKAIMRRDAEYIADRVKRIGRKRSTPPPLPRSAYDDRLAKRVNDYLRDTAQLR